MLKYLSLFIFSLQVTHQAQAHRDSNMDNLQECLWNQEALSDSDLQIDCNDLYHHYHPQSKAKLKKPEAFNIGAFNLFKLGSGDSRFKDLKLTAKIISRYSLVAASELLNSASEEHKSNINLSTKSELDFKKHYHQPGYIKLLTELRQLNSNWSLILSPSPQSDSEELLGFYYRADILELEKSDYCEAYNRKLREQKTLTFSGSIHGPTFGRKVISPYLNKSYACLLDIKKSENHIFRLPFTARFKTAAGFDFNYLSYHARFVEPLAVGGTCGFECLELINKFYSQVFHKEGIFLGTQDQNSIRFLKNHLDYLSLTDKVDSALDPNYSPVIKFRHAKPRLYDNMMQIKDSLNKIISEKVKNSSRLNSKEKALLTKKLLEANTSAVDLSDLKEHKETLQGIFSQYPFSEIHKRYKIWTSPQKVSRFYELSLIMSEMKSIADLEKDSDVLLGGDLNLEEDREDYFWNYLSENYEYSTVGISSPTSITRSKGPSNSYDHFLYKNKNSLEECKPIEASTLDFTKDPSVFKNFEHYLVENRSQIEKLRLDYLEKTAPLIYVNGKGQELAASEIKGRKSRSCWDKDIYHEGISLAEEWAYDFECRVLKSRLDEWRSYQFYVELISDHLPIGMKCNHINDRD